MAIIDEIIRREGRSYTNRPSDRGGPTKFGVTQDTLSDWRGVEVSADDVKHLTESEAREIYATRYISGPHFDRIEDSALRGLVIDCGVNHGQARAAEWLQHAAKVPADGAVGPVTLAAVNGADSGRLYRRVLAQRARFYGRLVTDAPLQAENAAGWCARVAEFIEKTP